MLWRKVTIIYSFENDYTESMKLVLKSWANISSYATKASLYVSVKTGNTYIASTLLEINSFDLSQCDTFHQSPIFIASLKGDLKVVELLLKYNFNHNICNKNGLLPLIVYGFKSRSCRCCKTFAKEWIWH